MADMYRILLVALMSAFFTFSLPLVANATVTMIYVDPISITSEVGESFSVNVSVVDVHDLYGWGFELYYNNTVLNGTGVAEGSFLKSGGTTFSLMNFTDKYNATHGRLLASCFIVGDVSGVNGDGVLAIVDFTTEVQGGPCVLKLCDTKLSDSNADPISHQTRDGTVTVIPEFSSFLLLPLFMVATLLAIIVLRKKFYVIGH